MSFSADSNGTDINKDGHMSFLVSPGFKYLRAAVYLSLGSVVLYVLAGGEPVRNGGTWAGYVLGVTGLLLILWLTWLGVKKRRYNAGEWSLKAWTAAHVYLGLALIVVATLHTGFQFAWNVHMLAYTLMMLVVVSGIFGVYAYARFPISMSANRRSLTRQEMLLQLADFDNDARQATMQLDDRFVAAVRDASDQTKIGGGVLRQLRNKYPNCMTAKALRTVTALMQEMPAGDRPAAERVMVALRRKGELLARIRRDIQLKALLEVWLFFHVPLAVALIAALGLHVFIVFWYW